MRIQASSIIFLLYVGVVQASREEREADAMRSAGIDRMAAMRYEPSSCAYQELNKFDGVKQTLLQIKAKNSHEPGSLTFDQITQMVEHLHGSFGELEVAQQCFQEFCGIESINFISKESLALRLKVKYGVGIPAPREFGPGLED